LIQFLPRFLKPHWLSTHQPGNPGGVPVPLRRSARVVAADCRPGVAIVVDALGQYPGTYLDVRTGIGKRIPGDALLTEGRRPRRVDLHETEVVAPIGVVVDSSRIEVALSLADTPEESRSNAVQGPGFLKTEGMCRSEGTECRQNYEFRNDLTHVPPHLINSAGGKYARAEFLGNVLMRNNDYCRYYDKIQL